MYDTNEDVLVVRKSDYQNNSIGDKYGSSVKCIDRKKIFIL